MIVAGHVTARRTCDVCGAIREMKAGVFRKIAGRYVCDWHANYIPEEALEKIPLQTFPVRPIKDAKPFAPRDTYEVAESELLSFLAHNYQTDYLDTTWGYPSPVSSDTWLGGVYGAAWTAIYFYDVISEAQRSRKTIAYLRTKLREIADWLLTRMIAGPHKVSSWDNTHIQWGAFATSAGAATGLDTTLYPSINGAAGIALLRAYQLFGSSKYLEAARAAAWHVRSAQCGGYITSWHAQLVDGGDHHHWGTFTRTINIDAAGFVRMDHYYTPGELTCLEFLVLFRSIAGNETIGSSDISLHFSRSRETTVTTAIAEAVNFWTGVGPMDATVGTSVQGFSITTPYHGFNSFPTNNKYLVTGTGSWEYSDGLAGTMVGGLEWATGIRALSAASQSVTTMFDWLMTFTSNATKELSDPGSAPRSQPTYTQKTLYGTYKGDSFDPKRALSTSLLVKESGSSVTKNATGIYDYAALGLLASLYSSRQQASFKNTKDALNEPRPRSRGGLQDGLYLRLPLLGRSGLGMQPYTSESLQRHQAVPYAAMTGLIYRQAPKAFMGRGHE